MKRNETAFQSVFNSARRRGFMQDVLAELSGRSDDLLSFEDVREQLHLGEPAEGAKLEEVRLDQIVGSVGRYRDFNRAFLPRASVDPARWSRIEQLRGKGTLPPIDLFRIGDAYFVRDGNHRVSVARARAQESVQARVVEIPIRVPLGPDTSADDLILKAGYDRFLEETSLDDVFPEQRIELTRPGGYLSLVKHVEVLQFYMGLRSTRFPSMSEAASDWYQTVYMPVVQRIRASGILGHFPGRTEADLYLWIADNSARLQMKYSADEESRVAVDSFANEHSLPAVRRWIRTILHRLFPRLPLAEPRERRPLSKSSERKGGGLQ